MDIVLVSELSCCVGWRPESSDNLHIWFARSGQTDDSRHQITQVMAPRRIRGMPGYDLSCSPRGDRFRGEWKRNWTNLERLGVNSVVQLVLGVRPDVEFH